MSAEGADPGQLDQLATQFGHLADDLDGKRAHLYFWIETDRFWRGSYASEFRQQWEHAYAPQLSAAVAFLRQRVKVLNDEANQQRVASGEAPVDHSGGGFLNRLFGDAEKGIKSVAKGELHLLEDAGKALAHEGEEIWNVSSQVVKDIGGNPIFKDAIGVLTVASDVLGVVTVFCPALAPLTLGIAAVVLVGHLAEDANKGKMDWGETAEDVAGVFGGGVGVKILGDAAKAAEAGEVASGAAESTNFVTKLTSLSFRDDNLPKQVQTVDQVLNISSRGARTLAQGYDTWENRHEGDPGIAFGVVQTLSNLAGNNPGEIINDSLSAGHDLAQLVNGDDK